MGTLRRPLGRGRAKFVRAEGQRVKVNKYARFSKADDVRRSLRFSNVHDGGATADGSRAAESTGDAVGAGTAGQKRSSWEYPDAARIDQRDPSTFGFAEIGVVLGAHGTRGELKVSSDSDFACERLCQPGPTWLRRPRRRAPREDRVLRGRKGPGSNVFLVTLRGVASREEAISLRGATLHVRRELRPELGADEVMLWELEGLSVVMAEAAAGATAADATESSSAPSFGVGATVGVICGAIPREELTGSRELGNDLLVVRLLPRAAAADADCTSQPRARPPPPPIGAPSKEETVEETCGEPPPVDGGDLEGATDGAERRSAQSLEEAIDDAATVLIPFVPQIVVDVRLQEGMVLIDPPDGLLDLLQPKRAERVVIRGLLPQRAESLGSANTRDL